MLIITRKKDEGLVINDDIKIFIVDVRGDRVRLGIESPPEASVHRGEVYEAIQRIERQPATERVESITESAKQSIVKVTPQTTSKSLHPPTVGELQARVESLTRRVSDQEAIIRGFLSELDDKGELPHMPPQLIEAFVSGEIAARVRPK